MCFYETYHINIFLIKIEAYFFLFIHIILLHIAIFKHMTYDLSPTRLVHAQNLSFLVLVS